MALGIIPFHLAGFCVVVFWVFLMQYHKRSTINPSPHRRLQLVSGSHTVNYSVISFISLVESLYPSCLNRSVDTSWKLSTLRASQRSSLVFTFKWVWRAVEIHFCKCKSHQLKNPQTICSSLKPVHCGRASTMQLHAQTCLSAVITVNTHYPVSVSAKPQLS